MKKSSDKLFKCDCMSEGVMVTTIFEGKDEDYVAVTRHGDREDADNYYTVELSFWGIGPYCNGKLTWKGRLRAMWYVWKYGTPYTDMVGLAPRVAKNLANHILYQVELIQHKIDNKTNELVKQQEEEYPHPMYCFQHGGSAACEAVNKAHGFICPKCEIGVQPERLWDATWSIETGSLLNGFYCD